MPMSLTAIATDIAKAAYKCRALSGVLGNLAADLSCDLMAAQTCLNAVFAHKPDDLRG